MVSAERPLLAALYAGGGRPLPWLPLSALPTPLTEARGLAGVLGCASFHVKRDDLTNARYGGNKVRKLELLLADAQARGAKTVLTFGAAGSNHCLATAIHGAAAGFRCISMLVPQHNAHSVRRNLLCGHRAGAVLDLRLGKARVALGTAAHFKDALLGEGIFPSVFPPGGSSPLGALGYVNAALELAEQVAAGDCPEPDVLYVASGTMGTCVGLALGLSLTPLKTRVMGVAVTKPPYTSEAKATALHGSMAKLLGGLAPGLAAGIAPLSGNFTLRQGFLGEDYALYCEAGMEAVRLAHDLAGLKLEGTYTGKALSAALHDGRAGALRGKHVLFWNTYNSADFSAEIAELDYHELPAALHRFFEEPVQPLDES